MGWVIGVDFDNTLVSYDDVMYRVAVEQGLITAEVGKGKREIRDRIRQRTEGEAAWQKLQSLVYGPRMEEARLIEGVRAFFQRCRLSRTRIYIISHKTEFLAWSATGTNLRAAASAWMERHRFFSADGLELSLGDVFFESTRPEKIERIRALGCTHFIDDLEETFTEPSFPPQVEKLLYAPGREAPVPPGVTRVSSWQEIHDYFFDAHG